MAAKAQVVPLRGAEVPAKITAADEPDVSNPRSGPTLPSSKRTSPTPSPPGTPMSQRTTSSTQLATSRVPSPLGRAPASATTPPRAEGNEEPLPRMHTPPRRAGDSTPASPPAAVPIAAVPGTPLRFARPAPPGLLIRTGFSASTGSLDSRPLRGSPLRAAVTVSDDGESDDGDDEDSDDGDSDDEVADGEKTAGQSKSSSNPSQPPPSRQRVASSKHSIRPRSVSRRKSLTASSTGSAKDKGSHATLFRMPVTMPEDHRPDGITDRVIRYVNEMRSTAMDPARFGFLSRLHFWTLLLGWGVSLADWYAIINACWNYAWLADARMATGHSPTSASPGHTPVSAADIGQDPAMLVHGIALSLLFVSACKEGLKMAAFGALLAQANEHMSSWLYAFCTHSLWLFPTILVSKVHQRRVLTSAALVSHPRVVMPDLFLTDLPLCMEAVLRVMYQPSWFLFANAVIILASTSFHMSRLIWMVILSLNEYGSRRQRIQSRQSAVEKWIHEVQTTIGLIGASSQRDQFLLALTDPSATLAQSTGPTKGSILKRATTWLSRGDSPTTSLANISGFLAAPLLRRRENSRSSLASTKHRSKTEGDLSSTALPSLADLPAAEPDSPLPLPSPPPPPMPQLTDDAVPPAPTTATPPIPPAPPAAPLPPSWPTFMQVYAVLCFRAVFDLAMDRIMTGADNASRTRDEFRACLRRHAAALRHLDPAAKGGGPWALDLRGSHQIGKTTVAAMVELAHCTWVRETARAWADPARRAVWLGRWALGLAAVAKKARGGSLVALRPRDVVGVVPLVADVNYRILNYLGPMLLRKPVPESVIDLIPRSLGELVFRGCWPTHFTRVPAGDLIDNCTVVDFDLDAALNRASGNDGAKEKAVANPGETRPGPRQLPPSSVLINDLRRDMHVFLDAAVLLFDMDEFDQFELDQYGKRTTRWQSHFRLVDQVLDNDMRSCRVVVVWCNYHKFKGRIMNRQYVAKITNDLLEAYPTLPTVARQIRAAKRPRRSDGGSASRRRSELVLPPAHRPSVIPPSTFDHDMPKPMSTLMAAVMAAGTTSPQATLPQQAPSTRSLSASSSTSDHDKTLTARILHFYFERKFAQLDRTIQPGGPAADLLTDASGTLPVVQNVLEVVRRRHFLRKLEGGTV